ncbi:hypothetical protein ACFJIS_21035 [Variovorax boronicumulans]|uniref:hypothetical protein n=1 Tax=Variovorax boronicumulans TaxID=436515 RepID=UPI0036F1D978
MSGGFFFMRPVVARFWMRKSFRGRRMGRARAVRINALELTHGLAPQACLPLLDYVAGPRAQFLTGQVLRLGAGH